MTLQFLSDEQGFSDKERLQRRLKVELSLSYLLEMGAINKIVNKSGHTDHKMGNPFFMSEDTDCFE